MGYALTKFQAIVYGGKVTTLAALAWQERLTNRGSRPKNRRAPTGAPGLYGTSRGVRGWGA
jgi:hypothetical protein